MPRRPYSLFPQEFFGEDFSPFIRQMQRAVNSALQDVWEPVGFASSRQREFQPEVSVSEDEREIRVKAELPGINENDVEVTYEPGFLVLKGEKKEEEQGEQKERGIRYSEWRYGAFERRIPLRAEVQENQIQANFDRGVLTVCLPKTEESRQQARRIQVKPGAPQQLEQSAGRGRGETSAEGRKRGETSSERPAAH
jgi:HSP20 family protein